MTFGAATGGAHWEIATPQNEAEVPYSLSAGIGGTLEQFPSVLFPSYPESGRSCGGVVGTETHRAVMPYGCVPLEAGQAGTTSEHNILSSFATAGDESGPQEPLYLNLYLPTHVDHDGAVVAAASVRVQALGGTLTEGEATAFLRAAGAPEAWIPDMLTISACESHHGPYAVGDSGNSLGQYQLWSGWFRPGEDPFDPLTNARVAVRVRETRGRFGGAGGWSCADRWGIP